MTDAPDLHQLQADPADSLMAALADAFQSLARLEHEALSVQCRDCDPTGERTERVRQEMLDRFDVDPSDANMLHGEAADVRAALLGILIPPCTHDHDDGEEP